MSWDLILWRGTSPDACATWAALGRDEVPPRIDPIPRARLRAALVEAFQGDLRVSDTGDGTEIQGRGWECFLGDEARFVQVTCHWGFASNVAFLEALLGAARRTGSSVFDPQTGLFWPHDHCMVEGHPWASVVCDGPLVLDEDGDDGAHRDESGFGRRVHVDRVDIATTTQLLHFDVCWTDDTLVRHARVVYTRVLRAMAALPGFDLAVSWTPPGDLGADSLDGLREMEKRLEAMGARHVDGDASGAGGVHLAIVGAFAPSKLGEVARELSMLEVFPRAQSAEKEQLDAIFGEAELYVVVPKRNVAGAPDLVMEQLGTLWAEVERICGERSEDEDDEDDEGERPVPMLVDLRDGREIDAEEVGSFFAELVGIGPGTAFPARCAFCKKTAAQGVMRFFAGESDAVICNECVGLCLDVMAAEPVADGADAAFGDGLHCDFCGGTEGGRLFTDPGANICDGCVQACFDRVQAETAES